MALVLVWLHGANSEDTKNSLAVGCQLPGQGYFFRVGPAHMLFSVCDNLRIDSKFIYVNLFLMTGFPLVTVARFLVQL